MERNNSFVVSRRRRGGCLPTLAALVPLLCIVGLDLFFIPFVIVPTMGLQGGATPRALAHLLGVTAVQVTPADVVAVYPSHVHRAGPVVAVLPRDGRAWYFRVPPREVALACLANAGFPVEWEERRATA